MSRFAGALGPPRAERGSISWPDKIQYAKDQLIPEQRLLADDTTVRIGALVGRRGGKTTTVRVRYFDRLLTTPKAHCLYIAATRSSAEELMWIPLKEIFEKSGFGPGDVKFNETKLKLTVLENKSQLQLVGADNKRDIEKLRGQYFHEVWIDESGSYPPELLRNLIERIIAPALGDYNGTLGLIGTPSHVLSGWFYEVTRQGSEIGIPFEDGPDEDDWSTHAWSLADGVKAGIPAMVNAWEAALKEKRRNGWSDDHPTWKREYLGLWAADDTENVFKYRPHKDGEEFNQWDPKRPVKRQGIAELPHEGPWQYVYCMDLGSADSFALHIFAFADHDYQLYHLYEYGSKRMYAKTIAQLLIGDDLDHDRMGGLFKITGWPTQIVADKAGLGGAFLDELANVYGIPIEAAEKKNKHDAIELFNGDLIDGKAKILKGSRLESELMHLQWATDDYGNLKENKSLKNDFSDAAIYGRRAAQHLFASAAPEPPPEPGTKAAIDEWAAKSLEKQLSSREPQGFEDDFYDYHDEF